MNGGYLLVKHGWLRSNFLREDDGLKGPNNFYFEKKRTQIIFKKLD